MARDEDRFGRRISDPRALRALSHRGRLAIMDHLQLHGPATATECAQVTGMSPSACSYHLRMLARYGFVVESPDETGRGDGRERVWKAAIRGWQSDPDESVVPAEARAIDAALARVLLDRSDSKVLGFLDGLPEPPEWRDALLISNSTLVATPDEVAALSDRLMELIAPYLATERPLREAPAGARLVHAALRLVPGAELDTA